MQLGTLLLLHSRRLAGRCQQRQGLRGSSRGRPGNVRLLSPG